MKRLLLVIACITVLFLVYTGVSYLRVEWLTWRHATDFHQVLDSLYTPAGGTTATLLKVFQYDGQRATLYVILRGMGTQALYMHFRREGTGWEEDELRPPKLIWSSGSADGWTWPPYWH